MRPGNYNTKQREAILDFIISLSGAHVTAAQIEQHFNCDALHKHIGRTTIYRYLEKLNKDGILRRYITDGASGFCYQYVGSDAAEPCDSHWHLKCEDCGELQHLECGALVDVERHVLNEHAFQVNNTRTVLYGKCNNCLNAKEDLTP